jgi:DHA1 family bicyclomycin/chloramphenicol resistance-like MFS transporter
MLPSRVSARLLAVLLASLSALGPLSIDAYLPSFREMSESLHATPLQIQQTLSAYLGPFAVMTLWHGALSDGLGRRRVILWALLLFALASIGCALAPSVEWLWVWRGLQGMTAGAGIVIGRAVVRDVFDGPAAQRLMSNVSIMFALAPAIAPILGGWIHVAWGWRAVFHFLALVTVFLWWFCWSRLPETLPPERRMPLAPRTLLHAYRGVLTTPAFLGLCGALLLNFLGFFIYVLSAPVFLMQHLGRNETEFIWLFGPAMSGLIVGASLSGRAAGRLSSARTLQVAYVIMGCAALANLLLNQLYPPSLPWSILPIPLYTTGMALAMPTLTLLALDIFPSRRGMAASCQTFVQSAGNALAAGLLAPLLWDSTRHLAAGMLVLLILGGGSTWLGYHGERQPRQVD